MSASGKGNISEKEMAPPCLPAYTMRVYVSAKKT